MNGLICQETVVPHWYGGENKNLSSNKWGVSDIATVKGYKGDFSSFDPSWEQITLTTYVNDWNLSFIIFVEFPPSPSGFSNSHLKLRFHDLSCFDLICSQPN